MDDTLLRTNMGGNDIGFGEDNHVTAYSRMTSSSSSSSVLNNNNNNNHHNHKNNNNNNTATANGKSPTAKVTLTNTQTHVKSCSGCGEDILDRFLLHAVDRYWHTNCLKCSCCNAHLGEIGSSCFTKNGMILCKNDYIRLFGSSGSCSSCGQNIPASEFVMKAQGNVYHLKCFTCVTCHSQLVPGDRYSILNGSLVCEQDYPKVLKGQTLLPQRTVHKVC